MSVYNYDNIKYEFTGGSVINCGDWIPPQEGVLLSLRDANGKLIKVYIDKRDAAHITELVKYGRGCWKKFKLPKMFRQKAGDSEADDVKVSLAEIKAGKAKKFKNVSALLKELKE